MDFGKALELMKQGKKVQREYWVKNGVYVTLENVEGFTNKLMVMTRRKERFPLDLSSDSILAEDWQLLK